MGTFFSRTEARGQVTRKQCVALHNLKMYPHTKLRCLVDMLETRFRSRLTDRRTHGRTQVTYNNFEKSQQMTRIMKNNPACKEFTIGLSVLIFH